MDHTTLSLITIPLFTGAIGYVTNWSGVWMLFYPVRFAGIRIPGLAPLANVMPRRIQQIPGLGQGGLGWQGIVPSRAAKMGSIAVDKGLSRVGSPRSRSMIRSTTSWTSPRAVARICSAIASGSSWR